MSQINYNNKTIYFLDKDNKNVYNELKKITNKKKYIVFIDEYDVNSYECNDCNFRYIRSKYFIDPFREYIYKLINLYITRFRKYDMSIYYEKIITNIGLDKKLDRLPKEINKIVSDFLKDTLDYYMKKIKNYNIDDIIDKLSIFIYDIYIILLFLTNKNTIFIIDKEHIKNILLIHKLVLDNIRKR